MSSPVDFSCDVRWIEKAHTKTVRQAPCPTWPAITGAPYHEVVHHECGYGEENKRCYRVSPDSMGRGNPEIYTAARSRQERDPMTTVVGWVSAQQGILAADRRSMTPNLKYSDQLKFRDRDVYNLEQQRYRRKRTNEFLEANVRIVDEKR